MQRVVTRLMRRGNRPAGISFGCRSYVYGVAGVIVLTMTDEGRRIVGQYSIPLANDPKHPYRGIEKPVARAEGKPGLMSVQQNLV